MSPRLIEPDTLKQWLTEGTAILVDVREPAEHRASRIAGARLMPLSSFQPASLVTENRRVVLHCLKGGRGNTACEALLKANPNLEVYNLARGIEGWAAAGLPVEHGAGKMLPLDRQVQLTIGIILLVTTALSVLVHPGFVALAAMIGMGLTVAGLTGFCGLGMVMARMPWNRA